MVELTLTSVHATDGFTFEIPDGHEVYGLTGHPTIAGRVLVVHGAAPDGEPQVNNQDPEEWFEEEMGELSDDVMSPTGTTNAAAETGAASLAELVEDLSEDSPLDDIPGVGEATLETVHVDPSEYTAGDLPADYYALAEVVGKEAADQIEMYVDGIQS